MATVLGVIFLILRGIKDILALFRGGGSLISNPGERPVGYWPIDRQEIDRQEIDRQEIDRQEHDMREVEWGETPRELIAPELIAPKQKKRQVEVAEV